MFDRNSKNSTCGYSEQLVTYIYGESGDAEKQKFAAHLEACTDCSQELAAFSALRSSFENWKNEFSGLETPPIEIPYETRLEIKNASGNRKIWLKNLRDFFSGVPMWQIASVSLPVLLICFGLVFFALNWKTTEEIAEGNRNPLKSSVSPETETIENKIVQPNADKPKPNEITLTEQKPQNQNSVKNGSNIQTNKRNEAKNQGSRPGNDRKKERKSNKEKLPDLMPYTDYEDNTLRLTDLFSEIDTRD